jgi:hypothetical protein
MVLARRSRSSGVRLVFFLFLAIVLEQIPDLVELSVRVEQSGEDSADVLAGQRQLHCEIVLEPRESRKMPGTDTAWGRVADAILAAPGALPEETRRAIARGEDPPALAPLAEKVRRHAYRIVDADTAALDTDTIYEVALAAALGVALEDRRAALEAIGK